MDIEAFKGGSEEQGMLIQSASFQFLKFLVLQVVRILSKPIKRTCWGLNKQSFGSIFRSNLRERIAGMKKKMTNSGHRES